MDITFNCDKCGQQIVIEEAGAGLQVECPTCASSISVPNPHITSRLRIKSDARKVSELSNPNTNPISSQSVPAKINIKWFPKLLSVLVIVAIGYYGGRFIANKVPKNQPIAAIVPNIHETTKGEVFNFFNTEQDAKADVVYGDYEKAIHSQNIDEAVRLQRSVACVFTNKTQSNLFWCKKIPVDAQRTLVLAYLCNGCSDGICPACGGKQVCNACTGGKQCVKCSGKGAFISKCTSCICSLCNGSGTCRACKGGRVFRCQSCNGDGQVAGAKTHETCSHCNGTGLIKSAFKGSTSTMPCIYCSSKGYLERNTMVQCSTCRGNGTVNCAQCNGSGNCSGCRGNGRLANCPLCGGSGSIRRECNNCSGNGTCPNCKGTGNCLKCEGFGKCRICQGSGLVTNTLLVNAGWLKQNNGYVVYQNSKLVPSSVVGDQIVSTFGKTLLFRIADKELWCISETNDFAFVTSDLIR